MTTFSIIVYGNGDLFREYFNAIVAAFGASHFKKLLHISILLAGITVIFSYTMRRDLMVIVRWFGVFYLAIYVLFMPQATTIIVDRVNGDHTYTVDNVPLGLAVLASYTSILGDALTQNIESNFTMPDYMPYHKTGMVFASQLVAAASQFEVTDATFDGNLREFVHQCVFYDVLLNKYSMDELTSTNNVWELVSANASPARAFVYNGTVTTCRQGVASLTADWAKVVNTAMTQYGQRIYPHLSSALAKSQMMTDLPISYAYLTKISESASEIMQQNMMANAIQRGVLSQGATLNATAAMESYAYTRATEQKRLTNKTLGDMAAYWLPLMKNAFEAIMYGSFIFIVLLSVFPFGGMIVKNYVYTLVWLQVWAPLYAIINLTVSYYAHVHSTAAVNGVLSLKAMSGILQINSDLSGLAGYLSLSVPFLSAGLVRGMAGTFTQLSQYVGGVTQSAGGAGASEAVTGNMSFGNTSLGNHNDFNTSANHMDTSGRISSGVLTTQTQGGSTLSKMPDGSVVMNMQGAMSSLGSSVNFAESLRASYSHQAEKSFTTAQNQAFAYSESESAGLRKAAQVSQHLAKSESSGEGWNIGTNSDVTQAFHDNYRVTKDYADRHGISYGDSANVLANAYVDSKLSGYVGFNSKDSLLGMALSVGSGVSGGVTGSASGGVSRTAGHTSSTSQNNDFSDAKSYIQDSGYSRNVNSIERAAKDKSFRTNNDEGARLVNDMSASFDRASAARHDMQSSYNAAVSARDSANLSSENAESINANANQHYKDWLANQPGTNGRGRIGYDGIESVQKDPEMAMQYGKQFLEQYKSKVESNWNHGMTSTEHGIQNQFHSNNQQIKGHTAINAQNTTDNNTVAQQAHSVGLQNQLVDHSAKYLAENKIVENTQSVENKKASINQAGQQEINTVQAEAARKRHGGLTHDMLHDIDTKN